MKVRKVIEVLLQCNLNAELFVWENGIVYPIELTYKEGYYVLSANKNLNK